MYLRNIMKASCNGFCYFMIGMTFVCSNLVIIVCVRFRYSYETLLETANFLLSRISVKPSIGIICGSGMGSYWNEGIYSLKLLPYYTYCNLYIYISTRNLFNVGLSFLPTHPASLFLKIKHESVAIINL